ncbi:MAG: GntR family transcriptional regulator [Bacteroidetes bacterium]|nr:GntR family transcriptional regulator [Bacteroidota bacterium]
MEPLYRTLQQKIKSQILSGIYHDGDLLPSENDLMKIHASTRGTVRQALDELVKEGYIIKQQGKGSIVQKSYRRTLGVLSVKGFSRIVTEKKLSVATVMIKKPVVTAWTDPFFYQLDEIEKNAGCIYLKRVRCVEKEPVMLETTFIPNLNLSGFCKNPFVKGSLFETLSVNYHIEITKVEQDLRAIIADKDSSVLLNVKQGAPLLHIYLKFTTSREHMNIYSSLLCNTENFSIGNVL